MAERDKLFEQFGPKLLEASIDFLLDSVNILRQNQGMPLLTKDEYLVMLNNHITELPDYDWMTEKGDPPA